MGLPFDNARAPHVRASVGAMCRLCNSTALQRPEPSRGEKAQYWFDNFFATDPMAKIYLVVAVNIVFVIFFGVCFHVAGSQEGDWAENFWKGFTFASDAAETVRLSAA